VAHEPRMKLLDFGSKRDHVTLQLGIWLHLGGDKSYFIQNYFVY